MATRQSQRNRKNVTPSAPKAKVAGAPAAVLNETPEPVTANGLYSWTHDYDYVKKDLRKLGIVSAVLFAAIIIAGFFM